jgi:hypothetical protein
LGGATLPLARFNRAHAPAVALPITNRLAASPVDRPPSMASTTRSRKSMLYGLPIRISQPKQEEWNHNSSARGIAIDSRFREDALGRTKANAFLHFL